ncbi:hypothetical protein L2E82_39419 [Cichorium intybus]|uniref:Uncharacterized protein n=1 Tax=Cichorium intybus TaxID=13427 RepID=A0ACB9AJW7_CICIN|nr:hypothetical protein L2E82_39419 [Cichorium intybus]
MVSSSSSSILLQIFLNFTFPKVFTTFYSHHKKKFVLAIDKSTLLVTSEIVRQSENSSKSIVHGNLTYVKDLKLLATNAITSGAFGFSGYIRIWDPRSACVVRDETTNLGIPSLTTSMLTRVLCARERDNQESYRRWGKAFVGREVDKGLEVRQSSDFSDVVLVS